MYDDDNFIYDDDDMFDDEYGYKMFYQDLFDEISNAVTEKLNESSFAYVDPNIVREMYSFKKFLESNLDVETKIETDIEILMTSLSFVDDYVKIPNEIKKEFDLHLQKADAIEICATNDNRFMFVCTYMNPFYFYPKSSD